MGKILSSVREFGLSFFSEISLEKKIAVTFTGTLAIFFLTTGIYLTSHITENIIQNTEATTRAELTAKDSNLISLERSVKGKIKILSKEANLSGEPEQTTAVLNGFMKENSEFSHTMFAKSDGEFAEMPKYTREKNFDARNTIWYKDAIAAGSGNMMIVTAPFQGLDEKARIGFYSSAYYYGEPYGVLGGTVDFAELLKMTGDTRNIIVLDNNDNIVFYENKGDFLFKKINSVTDGDLSILGQKNEGVSKVSLNGESMLAVVYKSTASNLKYIKLLNYNEVVSPAKSARNIITVTFLSILIISLILSKLLYKYIKKYFMNIEAQTEAIGEGRLDNIAEVKESSDELGRLNFAFGKMAGNVKSRLMKMETESQNLRAVLKYVSETLEPLKTSSQELTNGISAMAGEEETNIGDIKAISEKIEALASKFGEISALKTKAQEDIARLLTEADAFIKQAAEELDNAALKIKTEKDEIRASLNKETKELDAALQETADNANEISLMAFSAALEAAKGKNEKTKFAKIAEDIRKLAEVTEKSANRCKKGVNNLEPKFSEYVAPNLKDDFAKLLEIAKEVENSLNKIELGELETSLTDTEKKAKELSNRKTELKSANENALKTAETNNNNIEKLELAVKKAFV